MDNLTIEQLTRIASQIENRANAISEQWEQIKSLIIDAETTADEPWLHEYVDTCWYAYRQQDPAQLLSMARDFKDALKEE